MRLIGLEVENFRCFKEPIKIRFGDFTAIIGRNDVGKSTLLEALEIFFENTKADLDDASKTGNAKAMSITCEFDELPQSLVIDSKYPTSLQDEHLLSTSKTLIITKTYDGSLKTPKLTSIVATAEHPSESGYNDLLTLKLSQLIKRAENLSVDISSVNKTACALVRAAIWGDCSQLNKQEQAIPLDGDGGKEIWSTLQPHLPIFSFFKSDRASSDQDAEAQNPMKAAIKEAIKDVEEDLEALKNKVKSEVQKIANLTVEKLREMDPSLAETLEPNISTKNWDTLFSTSITGDDGIPLNKRGSGVKRLVLLNFFRAKAESDLSKGSSSSLIYAIEEPETGQHPHHQKLLLKSLRDLSFGDGRQLITTTHTPVLARLLPDSDIRFIEKKTTGERTIFEGSSQTSGQIASSLGILADHNVKIFIGVEGQNDQNFLQALSQILNTINPKIPDLAKLEYNGELIFIPLGGSNLACWSSRLQELNRPEFYLCDRDNSPPAKPNYHDFMKKINDRENCFAVATDKRELENYLHGQAICEAYSENGINISLPDIFQDFEDVPELVAIKVHEADSDTPWVNLNIDQRKFKVKRAKRILNKTAVAKMSEERLAVTDPNNEIIGWCNKINEMMY